MLQKALKSLPVLVMLVSGCSTPAPCLMTEPKAVTVWKCKQVSNTASVCYTEVVVEERCIVRDNSGD